MVFKKGARTMTTSELLNLSSVEISKLKKPQLRKIVQTLASTSNKRLKRLQQKGISTPASRYANKSGKFSTKGKNINQLRAEYIRAKNFLQSKTSTLKGYKQFKKEVQKNLAEKGINISSDKLEPIFNIYEKLKDINPSVTEKNLKYVTLQEISEELKDGQTEEEILSRINDNLSQMYEQEMELENYGTISDFFTIE